MPGSRQKCRKKIKALESAYIAVQEQLFLVPEVGLEPTRLAAHDFESRSSANSDTLAYFMHSKL